MEMPVNRSDLIYPELSYSIIGSAMDVHNGLGPGWDEWDYHRAMIHSLTAKGHVVASHNRMDLIHRDKVVDNFELDLLVDDMVILEFKHLKMNFHPEHYTQIINYLKRWDKRLGILINYGLERLSYQRIPYDCIEGTIQYTGKWPELEARMPVLCKRVSAAASGVLKLHGVAYGVNVYKKLLTAELIYLGSSAVPPILSPDYESLSFGERMIDAVLVDSDLLISISATGQNASSTDLAYLKSYMRQTHISNGILIDVGSAEIQLKGVL